MYTDYTAAAAVSNAITRNTVKNAGDLKTVFLVLIFSFTLIAIQIVMQKEKVNKEEKK